MSRVKRLFKPFSLTLYSVCSKNERFIVCINMEKDGVVFQVALLLKVTKTNLVVTKLAAGGHKHDSKVLLDTRGGGGVLNKVLNGEDPLRGPTPFPFKYHLWYKRNPFRDKWYPFHIPCVFKCCKCTKF